MNCRTRNPAAIVMALVIGSSIFTAIASAENIFVDRFDDSATATACAAFTANDCSLRGAIIRANGNGEDDTVWIPIRGTYVLSLDGSGSALGDLDITDNLVIQGWQRSTVLIEASGITGGHRVFEIHPGVTATIREVWITDSDPAKTVYSGAGIWNSGTLVSRGGLDQRYRHHESRWRRLQRIDRLARASRMHDIRQRRNSLGRRHLQRGDAEGV